MCRLLTAIIIAFLAFVSVASSGLAQTLPGILTDSDKDTTSVVLPDPLTRDAMRDVLSAISDQQARELLLNELNAKIEAREAEQTALDQQTILKTIQGWGVALGHSYSNIFSKITHIPGEFSRVFENYQSRRGEASLWRVPGYLFLCMTAGIAATFLVGFFVRRKETELLEIEPRNLWVQLGIVIFRFAMQMLKVAAFLLGGFLVNNIFNTAIPADNLIVRYFGSAIWWTFLSVTIARFMLSPRRSELRFCHVDDKTARFLTKRVGIIFGWSAFTLGMLIKLQEFGWVLGNSHLGFWVNLIFYLLIVLTVWQARKGISGMVQGPGDVGRGWRRFAALWPGIAIGLVFTQWLVVEIFVATGNLHLLSLTTVNLTLAIVLAMPLLEHTIPALVAAMWPVDPDESEALQKIHKLTQNSATRCGRVLALFLLTVFLLSLWGVSLTDIASQSVGGQIAGALTELMLILVVSFGLWELLNVVTERQVILERAVLEQQDPTSAAYGLTRLETVLPLVRGVGTVTIFILAVLAILGQLGVNILPLLAGAGVVGIAVGFGAQTLVKDIISGIFFLIDDAFRKDEYIDISTTMGTVEKLSIRSMQLRHHDGLLNTIPFGEIRQVANYSRDWGIMRLLLRVTYDTDVMRMATLINELGEQLLEDPDIGNKFDVKLTAEGVINTDDSALIFRAAYKTKALDQWAMRGRIYARIREMFDREGIKFASNEVTVRVIGDENGSDNSTRKKKIAAAAAKAVSSKNKSKS